MTGKRARLAFVHNVENTFIEIDRAALSQSFDLSDVYFRKDSKLFFEVCWAIASSDFGFGWFASWHTFVATAISALLRKEFLLVIGGYDLANMPEIGYGHQRGGLRKWVARATMNMATCLMTNSYFSRREAKQNAGLDPDSVAVVYHGIPNRFEERPEKPERVIILTVGNIDRSNLKRKGHEPFVRAAGLLPDFDFVVVGAWLDDAIEYLRSIATPNVQFLGRLSDEDLDDMFRRSSVYVQASAHEGFGVSLAESMLAGCVPVVSNQGALPEVVGDCGAFVDYPVDSEDLAAAIRSVIGRPELGLAARERVLDSFPVIRRSEGLVDLVNLMLVQRLKKGVVV